MKRYMRKAIGRNLYGVQHHERAQRVTHSLEALDEGSGTEVRGERARTLMSGHTCKGTFHRRRRVLCSYFLLLFFPPCTQCFSVLRTSKRCFPQKTKVKSLELFIYCLFSCSPSFTAALLSFIQVSVCVIQRFVDAGRPLTPAARGRRPFCAPHASPRPPAAAAWTAPWPGAATGA
jgi:hypothetical protein